MNNTKATLAILGVALVFLAIVIIPIAISNKKKADEERFPYYEKIEITEDKVKDISSEDYRKIKEKLEADTYFAREAMISNYSSNSYTSGDLPKMLWNFIFAYSLDNRKYMTYFSQKSGTFCMRSANVVAAFKELYNVNILSDIDYLEGYDDYVTLTSGKYCFNFGNVAKEFNDDLAVGIEGISVRKNVVTANIYLFEYYITYTDEEKQNVVALKSNIANSRFSDAISIVENNLNGRVTHKQLQFNILEEGKHFKYQILLSKMLDY